MADQSETTTLGRPYAERLAAAGPLGAELWKTIKDARDAALNRQMEAEADVAQTDKMLAAMRDAGLSGHLPTIEEVQEAWTAK